MKQIVLILLIVISLFSCNSNEKRSKDFGAFEMILPPGYKKFKLQGIDSYVGGITNGKDSLIFDYGWYSGDLSSAATNQQLFAIDTINGKLAEITRPKIKGKGFTGLYIDKAYKDNKIKFIGFNIEDEESILEAFKSIRFPDSDTTINSKEFDFSITEAPSSGRKLFLIHCAACHFKDRNMTAPAFSSIEESKFYSWILDTTAIIQPDSTRYSIKYHRETFGKTLNEIDVQRLMEYSNSDR